MNQLIFRLVILALFIFVAIKNGNKGGWVTYAIWAAAAIWAIDTIRRVRKR
ncbi:MULTISPECIES: hypothetical protein [Aneurinibacillus]|uniref:Uncharacterized protein n=1 Tax=Aneurinibacillus thermoaerophilus TaxID=143495 RepID=A0A1G8E0I3_ANETH|nr:MULTISPECIES: hypothetical protein [Aneurinibacillus]MED0677269.1 hypothetical protein [Aneurinibacillus thermoaerophilus]MED0677890.1 hypothetical protein [Aneurinibacillus thermoaerophilus]MED0738554.1 hypothetical protein [Aneurinibacillus thermoaerophilus]MED0758399.1 hypothetical protein [Aneurinibacillus thermoaerophilus]MED0760410.1 hypothetical protein [Aneurinibacillus thermoaerophilus]